ECDSSSSVSSTARRDVSILTRPEGRVRRVENLCWGTRVEFQSSPGPKAECDCSVIVVRWQSRTFQSSPGPKAECDTLEAAGLDDGGEGFQSSPGPKAE